MTVSCDLTPEVRALLQRNPHVSARGLLEALLMGGDAVGRVPARGRLVMTLSPTSMSRLLEIQAPNESRSCLINNLLRRALLSLGPPPRMTSKSGPTRD